MYTTFQIENFLNLPRTTLQSWMSAGHIVPTIRSKKRGSKNLFSEKDLITIAIFQSIVSSMPNMPRKKAAKIALENHSKKTLTLGYGVITIGINIDKIKRGIRHDQEKAIQNNHCST